MLHKNANSAGEDSPAEMDELIKYVGLLEFYVLAVLDNNCACVLCGSAVCGPLHCTCCTLNFDLSHSLDELLVEVSIVEILELSLFHSSLDSVYCVVCVSCELVGSSVVLFVELCNEVLYCFVCGVSIEGCEKDYVFDDVLALCDGNDGRSAYGCCGCGDCVR